MAVLVKAEIFLDKKFITAFLYVSADFKNTALLIGLGRLFNAWSENGYEPDCYKISVYNSDEWRFLPKVVPMGERDIYMLDDFKTLFQGRYFIVMVERRGRDVFVGTNLPTDDNFESNTSSQKLALSMVYEKLKKISINLENLRWKRIKKIIEICSKAESEIDSMLQPFELEEKRKPMEIWSQIV